MGEIKWMQEGPFGMMVHYLKGVLPREGEPVNDWNKVVNNFNVKEFCNVAESTGTKWLIFPFGQNSSYYCSPNEVLEKLLPYHCTERDLMLEIAKEIKARGIRLIAYLPSETDSAVEEIRNAFGWDAHPSDKSGFQELYMDFIRVWAERLGKLLDGWWYDGCYNAYEYSYLRTREWSNKRFDYDRWAAASKAGNPEAVLAMNSGAGRMVRLFNEEYLAGEINDLSILPESSTIDGAQWHALTFLDCFWGHVEKPGPIVPPRFSNEELTSYLKACHQVGGGVTLNVGIYQDGIMAQDTIRQLRQVSSELKK